MSKISWKATLQTICQQHNRLAIVGIGNVQRADDGAGMVLVQRLKRRLRTYDKLLLLEAGIAPENATGQLRQVAPDAILLVDAVDMHTTAGTVNFVDIAHIADNGTSTHTLPVNLLTDYLKDSLGCAVYLLGIQPLDLTFDQPLASPIEAAIDVIVDHFCQYLMPD